MEIILLGFFFFLHDEAVAIYDVAWLYSEEEQGKQQIQQLRAYLPGLFSC